MRRRLLASLILGLLVCAGTASGAPPAAPSFASAEIARVVAAGLMSPSVAEFRPDDPLTATELATVVASLGGAISVDDPYRPVTVRELDARLVSLVGLRSAALQIRLAALNAGLSPKPWLGTETVARMLGLRINHERASEALELQLTQPATRAEAAYSIARVLGLTADDLTTARETAATFAVPYLTDLQRAVLASALGFVGSPYVWAGTSEHPQKLFGKVLPGGFDCSGFVWRVYKLERYPGAPELARVLHGRTTYAMSGEVARSARIARDALEPGDVVFFGDRGARSTPAEVGHTGIYVGNGWMVHSSRFGTTLTPMRDWYETRFAWARRPLAEAGLGD
ncbi:MAG TPA: NlpC/P60 family protein [Gaiellaceae bacterium]|nr:NlpC/P60 family protein [Gaiellaceae bacterium]